MTKLAGEKVRIRIRIGEGDRYGDKLLNVLAKRLRHPRNWTRIAVVLIILLAAGPAVGHSPAEARGNRFARGSGEKGFDGKAGPWLAEARLVSPKERGEQARSAGKTGEPAPPTYRLLFSLAEIRPGMRFVDGLRDLPGRCARKAVTIPAQPAWSDKIVRAACDEGAG